MTTSNGTGYAAGDWNQDDDDNPPQGTASFLTICLIVSLFLMPLGCFVYFRNRQSVQPVNASAVARTAPAPTNTKEEMAKRLTKLQEQFANGEVQKVSRLDARSSGYVGAFAVCKSGSYTRIRSIQVLQTQDFEMDGSHDEEEGVVVVTDTKPDDKQANLSKLASIKSLDDESNRHLSGLTVRLTPTRTTPNCCAICLNHYQTGDTVIWSTNSSCSHAFHRDCMLGWLVKTPAGKPAMCPCCRQAFMEEDTGSS